MEGYKIPGGLQAAKQCAEIGRPIPIEKFEIKGENQIFDGAIEYTNFWAKTRFDLIRCALLMLPDYGINIMKVKFQDKEEQ